MSPLDYVDWLNTKALDATDGSYARYLGYIDNYYLGET